MATMPRKWTGSLKSTVLHVIALARFAVATAQAQLAGDRSFRPQRRREEIQLLREELRLVRARLASIDPLRRPRYAPVERMAILALRAARGWSTARTARRFLVSPATIAEWTRRVDEHGPDALVQLSRPINKFPDFVAHLVQRLKVHCPTLGKRKVAAMLARAGLHLGATTVARILKGPPRPASPVGPKTPPDSKPRTVVAKRPNQVWHVDLTVVPTAAGLWCPWAPQAVPQCWPFCWWVAVVVDNCSRRVVGAATFLRQPSSVQTRAFLGKAMVHARARPKYLVCDRGVQFDCEGFRNWCRTNRIRPRFGALGRHGSIAVVERCIRTLKELLRQLPIVPLDRHCMRREMTLVCDWYNEHRPHDALGGKTPNEVYHNRFPAHRKPRYEPRSHWPRGSPCAQPWALVRGRPGSVLLLDLRFLEGRKHLPIVTVRPAA